MSSNDQFIIVKRKHWELHWNGCVDNEYDFIKEKPYFKAKTKEDIDKKIKELESEGIIPEYGIVCIGIIGKDNKILTRQEV